MILTAADEELRLGGKLGDGAAGIVRKAYRLSDRAPRAIKFLAPDPKYIDERAFDDVAARFTREGMRGAKLEHPHLVHIYGYEANEGGCAFRVSGPLNPFISMEWVRGRSLESYIRGLPGAERQRFLPDKERLQIAIQISKAIERLHTHRIVHRDVKPANVFLTRTTDPGSPWHAKLGDFGVVKWGEFHQSLATGTLTVTSQQGLGTLKYMAPEQALDPKSVSIRSDIYPLGITLFELFTGRILPSAHHVFGIMSARLARGLSTAARFHQLGVDLPFEFSDLGELLLDMHLRGMSGRPAISKVVGHLQYQYSALFPQDDFRVL